MPGNTDSFARFAVRNCAADSSRGDQGSPQMWSGSTHSPDQRPLDGPEQDLGRGRSDPLGGAQGRVPPLFQAFFARLVHRLEVTVDPPLRPSETRTGVALVRVYATKN